MNPSRLNPRLLTLLAVILIAVVYRLIGSFSHTLLSIYSPIGALALFGGAYFSSRTKAFLLPLGSLWFSDIMLNRFLYFGEWKFFYEGFYWVYGTFALTVLLGSWMLRKITPGRIILAGVTAALLHWLITDFGIWLNDIACPKTRDSLVGCYADALPYLQDGIIGNLLFSAALFGSFEWARRRFPVLSMKSV